MGQKLHHRIEVWKKLLLDFGKRNRLINFKDGKRSNVHIVSPSYEAIFEKTAVKESPIVFPYSKKVFIDDEGNEFHETVIEGDVETNKTVSELQKTLKVLRYRANTSIEEQGINILFLAFGMLKWRENDESIETFSSPIILVPVKLVIESITSPYKLVPHEDEIVVNPTLLYKLENDFGIILPDFDGTQDSISDYFDRCEKKVQNKGWTIDRDVNLSNLSFLKINMYKDLERNEERLCSNPIVSAIAGEGEPITLDEDISNYDHDKKERPIDVFQVVDADSSQQDAILLSKKGVSFVLQGPPGTGKSQTITNIISEALADGKKVLFVSEKMAALQVVYNRLANVGLSDFCMTLHSHKANKKEVLQELANSISIDRKKVKEEALAQLDILLRKREELNEYQKELHTSCSALKTTIFEINGKLAKLAVVPDVVFPISDVEKMDSQDLNNKVYLLRELEKTIGKRSKDYKDNVWRGAIVDYLTNELRHDIDSKVSEIIPLISSLNDKASLSCTSLGVDFALTIEGVNQLMDFLKVAKDSPLIPEKWLTDDIEKHIATIEECRKETALIHDTYKEISDRFNQKIFDIDCKSQKTRLLESKNKAFSVLRFTDNSFHVVDILRSRQRLFDASTDIERVFTQAFELAEKIGLDIPDNLDGLELFVEALKVLIQVKEIKPTNSWLEKGKFNQLKQSLVSRKKVHDDYSTQLQKILNEYDKDILTIECYPMLQRFRGEYATFFRFLNKQYKSDIRAIQSFSKTGKKLSYSDAIETLTLLKEVADNKKAVEDLSNQCKDDYGVYYRGVDTQWDVLRSDIDTFENLFSVLEKPSDRLQSLLINGNLLIEELMRFIKAFEDVRIKEKYGLASNLLRTDIDGNVHYKNVLESINNGYNQSKEFVDVFNELLSLRKEDTTYDSLSVELDKLELYQEVVKSLEQRQNELSSIYEDYYVGVNTDWDRLCQALIFAKNFKKCVEDYSLSRSCVNKICSDAESVKLCGAIFGEISNIKLNLEKPLSWFYSLFEDASRFDKMNLVDFANYLASCKNNKHLLEEWVDYRSNLKKCETAGLQPFVEQIDTKEIDTNYIADAYLKRFYRLWLDKMMAQFPAVRNFRGRIQEQNIQEFCKLDTEQFRIAQARVRERLVNRIPDFNSITSSRDEIGVLKRELAKQRRIMPLRKLFMAIPNLISTLKPCFMMSPLSVSVFLEAQSYEFDLVIFDEASQVHTEDAIGAIMRGKQVIIVGDTKQLPPTNFFATSLNEEDFDVDIMEEEKDDDAGAYESILEESVTVLPERSLRWHYRSRDEHLIAFSNVKIYNGSLVTFPSAIEKAPDLGVEYIHVADGVYDRSGRRNNMIEAKRVAELVFEHFKKHPDRSLGVVTFSEAQQNAVDAAIRQLRLANGSMERFFAEDKEEPFFIKNLENVQGDERDTIIFSIGYAKDSRGIMYMNFGPLSRDGGYRRLNVAITRAKYNVKLVGSIVATDIDIDKTSAEGVKLLRSYIEYAQQGVAALEKELRYTNELDFDSPFEEAVYDFLVSKGYEVVTQVGCSGFRIDMAIKHPTQNGKFAIGIECDGAMYHSSRTVRERDRLRQTVLEDMGWKIYRIWSTDWIKSQKSEEDKLVEAIEMALSGIQREDPLESLLTQIDENTLADMELEESVEPRQMENMGYGFDIYKWVDMNDYWQDTPIERIRKVIEAQQPIHFEALCKILAPLWGNQKATNVIRRNVNYYLKHYLGDTVDQIDGFVAIRDFDNLRVRVPETTEDVRPIEYISKSELALAMKTIAEKSFGITPDGLITETARAFGFKRTGDKISTTLKSVYEKMIKENVVKEIDGKVCVR